MGYICLHWRLPPCKNHGIYNEFCIQSIYRPSLLVDIINLIDLNIIIPWFLNGELTYKWTPYMEESSMDGGSSSIRCNSEQFKWPQSWHGTMPSFTAVYSRSILIYKMDTNELIVVCLWEVGTQDKDIEGISLAVAPEHLLALVWHFCVQEELKSCCLSGIMLFML